MVQSVSRPTFGGLATGLDTNALLEGLLALERAPLESLQSRRAEIDTQRGLMRELNTKLLALRDAARELDNRNTTGTDASTNEEFLRYEGKSSDDDIVTVSAGFGASPGDIDVTVKQLATNSRRVSNSYSSSSNSTTDPALAPNESITISLDNGDPDAVPPVEATLITIEAGAQALSLDDLRDEINTADGNGGTVRADILRVSDGDFRLVLTSSGTGSANELQVTGAFSADEAKTQVAVDAVVNVFGEDITRGTNLIDDILPGITLRLRSRSDLEDENDPTNDVNSLRVAETVTVDVDVDAVAEGLEKFVNAYNDVVSFIDKQFSYNETTKSAGPLAGDFTLRGVQTQLREMVSSGYSFSTNRSNPFAPSLDGAQGGTITGIGIELGGGGKLSLDKTKLEEALALDATSVREFLSGRARAAGDPANADAILLNPDLEPDLFDEGFASQIATQLERIVRSGDGTLAERDAAYARRLDDFDDSIDRFESRLSKREETLIQRFSSLESIVAGLQSQQGFLSSF